MRFQLTIVNVLLFTVICFNRIQVMDSSPASLVKAAVQGSVVLRKALNNVFQKNNRPTKSKTVTSFIEKIPVIGDLFNLFSGDSGSDVSSQLADIQSELKNLVNLQEQTLSFLESLQRKIDFLVLKNQIATASKEIKSCAKDLEHYLQNPDSQPEKDRLIGCQNIRPDVRQMASILKEEEFTLKATKIFDYMIKVNSGNCDGVKIMDTYKFLFGLFLTGCESMVASEAVEFERKSTTLLQECKQYTQQIENHMKTVYSKCSFNTCARQTEVVTSAVASKSDNYIENIKTELGRNMPWFSFSVFKFSSDPNVKLQGDSKPSAILLSSTHLHFVVIWTPFVTQKQVTSRYFRLEYDTKPFISEANEIDITATKSGNKTIIKSYFDQSQITFSYSPCALSKKHFTPTSSSQTFKADMSLFTLFAMSQMILVTLNCFV